MRRQWMIGLLAAAMLVTGAGVGHAATDPATLLARRDVVVGGAARIAPADLARLKDTAARLRAGGTPVKFLIRRDRPATGPTLAQTLRDRLAEGATFEVIVFVLWERPRRGVGIAGPFRAGVGQAAFERHRAEIRADAVTGLIALADDLTGAAVVDPAPGAEDPLFDEGSDDGVQGTPFSFDDPDPFSNSADGAVTGLIIFGFLLTAGGIVWRIARGTGMRSSGRTSQPSVWPGDHETHNDGPVGFHDSTPGGSTFGDGPGGSTFGGGGAGGGDFGGASGGDVGGGSSDAGGGDVGGASGGDV